MKCLFTTLIPLLLSFNAFAGDEPNPVRYGENYCEIYLDNGAHVYWGAASRGGITPAPNFGLMAETLNEHELAPYFLNDVIEVRQDDPIRHAIVDRFVIKAERATQSTPAARSQRNAFLEMRALFLRREDLQSQIEAMRAGATPHGSLSIMDLRKEIALVERDLTHVEDAYFEGADRVRIMPIAKVFADAVQVLAATDKGMLAWRVTKFKNKKGELPLTRQALVDQVFSKINIDRRDQVQAFLKRLEDRYIGMVGFVKEGAISFAELDVQTRFATEELTYSFRWSRRRR